VVEDFCFDACFSQLEHKPPSGGGKQKREGGKEKKKARCDWDIRVTYKLRSYKCLNLSCAPAGEGTGNKRERPRREKEKKGGK
jgi:hypothetical protein